MKKPVFVLTLVFVLLSSIPVGAQTAAPDTPQITEEILKQQERIDSLKIELERIRKDAYEKAIQGANTSISVSTYVMVFVGLIVSVVGILSFLRIREIKADYKETKAELKERFEEELTRVREYKEEIKAICDEMKEKRKFVDEETENFKKRMSAQREEVPADFSKEVSGLTKKDSKTAIEDYEKIMNKVFDAEIYHTMAYNYYLEERYDEAISEFRKAIKLNPKNYEAYFNWALALSMSGRYEEAAKINKTVTELKPDAAEPYYNWGWNLSRLGRHRGSHREI